LAVYSFYKRIFAGIKKKRDMQEIKVIAFDADDTLWDNQVFYDEVESEFCRLLSEYGTAEEVSSRLFDIEMENMDIYKYGAKPFTLSMAEAAVTISRNRVPAEVIGRIVEMGKELLEMPIRLLGGVTEALETLKDDYKLVVATKGDLLDQERKLQRSGIAHYFDHTEIMTDKAPEDYQRLISSLDVAPQSFLMVGNSLKSDVLPVLSLGGQAIHVPAEAMWKHEEIHPSGKEYLMIRSLAELPEVLRG
jgi:putative hydrolase of the HAD superfamily